MDMKITFLGTGTSSGVPYLGCSCEVCQSLNPKDKRFRASVLLEIEGKSILIDCGPDFRQQALRAGVKKIDAVLLTHQHVDHMMGLDDLRVFGEVDIYADKNTCEAIYRVFSYCFNNNYHGIPQFSLHEISNAPFLVDGIEFIPIEVLHYKLPIHCYRIGDFAYITDFKTIDDSEKLKLKGVKTLVVNALRFKDHFSHATVDEALSLINEITPDQAYLTHVSHEIGFHDEVNKKLPSNVRLAYDGLELFV
jgi:phosphoribosyl 1,2-cyclic phosphate phosphodiesterase